MNALLSHLPSVQGRRLPRARLRNRAHLVLPPASAAAPGPAPTSSATTSGRPSSWSATGWSRSTTDATVPVGVVRSRGGDQLPRAHRGRRDILRRDGAGAQARRRFPLHGAQGRTTGGPGSRSSGCSASRPTRKASATRETAIRPRPAGPSWSDTDSGCRGMDDYCRFFTESLEDMLNFAYHRKAMKGKKTEGAGLPRRHRADVGRSAEQGGHGVQGVFGGLPRAAGVDHAGPAHSVLPGLHDGGLGQKKAA